MTEPWRRLKRKATKAMSSAATAAAMRIISWLVVTCVSLSFGFAAYPEVGRFKQSRRPALPRVSVR